MWKRSFESPYSDASPNRSKFYIFCLFYAASTWESACTTGVRLEEMSALRLLHQSHSHYPSSQPDIYIYSIVPCLSNTGLAFIDSADEVLILDRQSLRNQGGSLPGVPSGVTCLARVDEEGNVVTASGRDGSVAIWDLRSGERVARYLTGMHLDLRHGRSLVFMEKEH